MSSKIRIINSVDELTSIVQTKDSDEIIFSNLDIKFALDYATFSLLLGMNIPDLEDDNCVEFNKVVVFNNVKCPKLEIVNFEFTEKFEIRESDITTVRFNNCNFKSDFSIYNFKNAITELYIQNSSFSKKVSLYSNRKILIKKFSIDSCVFYDSLFICGFTILKNNDTGFYIWEDTRIEKSLKIENSFLIINDIIISASIGDSLFFENINNDKHSNIDIELGGLSIYKSNIENKLSFKFCNFGSIDIEESIINDIYENNFKFQKLKNRTAQYFYNAPYIESNALLKEKYVGWFYENMFTENLKDFLYRIINIIDQKQNPQKTQFKYKKRSIGHKVSEFILSIISALFSSKQFILFMNKYSNNYNRSWVRGIAFTCFVSLLFYFLLNYYGMDKPYFVIDGKMNGFGTVLNGYLYIIDIFDFTKIDINFKLNSIGYTIMFIAKIFIAYGCWQTISAFFKFRK